MTDLTKDIALDFINEPPAAMRTEIDRDAIFELSTDIKRNGLINPITVRPVGDRYEIVAGHRRFLAHRYGGLPTIRCIVRELSDNDAFAIMASENLKRENVNPVDEAIYTQRLLSMYENDVERVAEVVGRSVEWVRQRQVIAALPDNVKEALKKSKITIGVAIALAKIKNDIDLQALLDMAISQGASIVLVNYWVAQWEAGLFGQALMSKIMDPNDPGVERQVVMLTCAIDGKKYPAKEFESLLIHSSNMGYVEALKTAVQNGSFSTGVSAVENVVQTGAE